MDRKKVSEAHPGFVNILSLLSLDEVIIIYKLNNRSYIRTQLWDMDPNNPRKPTNLRDKDNEFPLSELMYPEHFQMYISHLYHLNLINSNKIDEQPIWQNESTKQVQAGGKIVSELSLSEYGKLLSKACME